MDLQRTAGPGEINHAVFDLYSWAHGAVGVIAAVILTLGFWPMLGIAIAWEVVEHLLKNLMPWAFPYPTQDTLANASGDVLSVMLGWSIGRLARSRPATARAG
jgi:hypothetical protein